MKGVLAYLRSMGVLNIRPAVYGWFFNFMFSILLYYSVYKIFAIPAGDTLIMDDTGTRISVFTFLSEIFQHHSGSFPLVFSFALVFTLGFLLVSVFVSGGIYTVFVDNERATFTNLIANSTLSFFSMVKVALMNLINLVAAMVIPAISLTLLIILTSVKVIAPQQLIGGILYFLWGIMTILFLAFSMMIYDFSRVFKLKEEKSTWYSFKQAIRFTYSHKLDVIAVLLLYFLSLVIVYLIYFILIGFVESFLYIWIMFVLYQVFIMIRYYLKVVVIRTEIRLAE